jgi:hypothetical protein
MFAVRQGAMCRLIASALGTLIGCTDATAPVPADLDSHVHATSAGRPAVFDDFALEDQASLAAEGLPGADYFYRVTDADGTPVSQDAPQCRRRHVDTIGTIDIAYDGSGDGEPCPHRSRFAVGSGLTLQLMPFGDSWMQHYRVEVSPHDSFTAIVGHAFAVVP